MAPRSRLGNTRNNLFVFLALAVTLAGCGGGNYITEEDINKPDVSLVYGYMDMDEAPSNMGWFQVKRVLPKSETPYWGFGVKKGLFFHEALPPGSYQLSKFGGASGFMIGPIFCGGNTHFTYDFPAQGEGFRIKEPGMHFLGTFAYRKAGTFWKAKFDIEAVKTPTELEVLQMLALRVVGTKWESKVAKRINQLSR